VNNVCSFEPIPDEQAVFDRFAAGNSHEGRLTGAELRLIAEWLDIGAQYFNNAFDPDAPQN